MKRKVSVFLLNKHLKIKIGRKSNKISLNNLSKIYDTEDTLEILNKLSNEISIIDTLDLDADI